jgi:nicotinamidase/pyrazinamidase
MTSPSPVPAVGAGDALLVVDVQNDFLPGGSLAVPAGDAVLPAVGRALQRFAALALPVFASRPWPPHCVAGTPGADFPDALRLPAGTVVISKATTPARDAYSAFDGTDLHARLQTLGVRRLIVCGLATDYCVQASVLDALARGYAVVVLADGVAAVDVQPGDGERALATMRQRGAVVTAAADVLP